MKRMWLAVGIAGLLIGGARAGMAQAAPSPMAMEHHEAKTGVPSTTRHSFKCSFPVKLIHADQVKEEVAIDGGYHPGRRSAISWSTLA